ncbi:MAG: hypothetical protein CML98_05360 [Rhodobiaceae bacterium]|nr:hypothetical protein [Rhodobiaceae bacterium]|tara:strand:- start:14355 stop:14837 length:483 start_codon:yes stop_codon:yes gene_type:complete
MKAASFQYQLPEDLHTALQLINSNDIDALPLAGGQSLMPMMNFRISQPDLLVDLNKIDSHKKIEYEKNFIKIGSMVKYSEMEKSDLIKEKIPLINHVIPYVAHSAIRNRGTIGGSVALADPAAIINAVNNALRPFGVTNFQIPMTPNRMLETLKATKLKQ